MDLINTIREQAKSLLSNTRPCHDWSHTERVYNLCILIGEKEGADLEILALAALLHDIAREEEFKSNGKICHAEKGAEMAREILDAHGFDKDRTDRVIHCIERHRFRKNRVPESKEAMILFDSDKLDSIGAIGIARAIHFAGSIGSKVHNDKGIDVENAADYSEDDTAYREFLLKLSKVKDKMFTAEGRRIAESRHDFMVQFFDRLNKEVDGES